MLIDLELQPQEIYIQSLADGVMDYFDENRQFQSIILAEIVRLRDIAGIPIPAHVEPPASHFDPNHAPMGLIILADGQRFTGQMLPSNPDGQTIRWQHPTLGVLETNLEHIIALSRLRPHVSHTTGDSDVIELINGDRLGGVITAIAPEGIQLQLNGANAPMSIPIERVRVLHLINPKRTPHPDQHTIHLTDTSRVHSSLLAFDGSSFTLTPTLRRDNRPVQLSLSQVSQIDPAGPYQLVGLAELPHQVTDGGAAFGLEMPPSTDGGALRLHAPVTVTFELPTGAHRMVAQAALDVPPGDSQNARWADMDLIISTGNGERASHHLNADRPAAYINTPVSGGLLTIRLDPAANGPIMDRLILRDASILTRRVTQP